MAYFMKPCKTIISYGILRASWTRCGKSSLIDEIFSTDFTCNHKGNYNARASSGGQAGKTSRNTWDIARIDLQMPRNIDSYESETQWQILDVSRLCDPKIIEYLSWKVNALFIHVLAMDLIKHDKKDLGKIFGKIAGYEKKVVIFVRDIDELNYKEQDLLDL